MNNKLNYNILVELGKSLLTGLFPYVFLHFQPKTIISAEEKNSISLKVNVPKNIACTKTKKKLLYYYPEGGHDLSLNNINCFSTKKFNNTLYFKINANKINKNIRKRYF